MHNTCVQKSKDSYKNTNNSLPTPKKTTSAKQTNSTKLLPAPETDDVIDQLVDGSSMKTNDVLDLASDFLGKGYTEPKPGSGRFVSADGRRVFRMGENNILGKHGGGPHVNFEMLEPNPLKPGKMTVVRNIHIYI